MNHPIASSSKLNLSHLSQANVINSYFNAQSKRDQFQQMTVSAKRDISYVQEGQGSFVSEPASGVYMSQEEMNRQSNTTARSSVFDNIKVVSIARQPEALSMQQFQSNQGQQVLSMDLVNGQFRGTDMAEPVQNVDS